MHFLNLTIESFSAGYIGSIINECFDYCCLELFMKVFVHVFKVIIIRTTSKQLLDCFRIIESNIYLNLVFKRTLLKLRTRWQYIKLIQQAENDKNIQWNQSSIYSNTAVLRLLYMDLWEPLIEISAFSLAQWAM